MLKKHFYLYHQILMVVLTCNVLNLCFAYSIEAENSRAFHGVHLVRIEITGSQSYIPPKDSYYHRAHRIEDLVLLQGTILEVYNGPENLVGQSVSLGSLLASQNIPTLILAYNYDGITLKGKEPIGAQTIVPVVYLAHENDYANSRDVFLDEFPDRSVFSRAHPASRTIIWNREVGHVSYYPNVYNTTMEWALDIKHYNSLSTDENRKAILLDFMQKENPLTSVSAVHILFRDYQTFAMRVAQEYIYRDSVLVPAKVAIDHELTSRMKSSWIEGGQTKISNIFNQILEVSTNQNQKDLIAFRDEMVDRGYWTGIENISSKDAYVWGVEPLPAFSGYLVRAEIIEVINGRMNLLTGDIVESPGSIYDAIAEIRKVYVGPKELEGIRFSMRGNVKSLLNGNEVTLRPVTQVELRKGTAGGVAENEKGLWHLSTAIGKHQEAFLGSLTMAERGYSGYIPYVGTVQAGAWKHWAEVLGVVFSNDVTPSLATLHKLLEHDSPEVVVWACHAIARRLGQKGAGLLLQYISRNEVKNYDWVLLGIEDAFSAVLKDWHSTEVGGRIEKLLDERGALELGE